MHDVRLRIAAVFLLSFLSFLTLEGALAALIWWLFFGAKPTLTKISWKTLLLAVLLLAFVPAFVMIFASTSSPLGYGVRMTVIVLLAFWFGALRSDGEFLDLSVWALGNRTGFELGVTAELSMQALSGVADDFYNQRTALKIKEQKLSVKTLLGVSSGLLVLSLSRAENLGNLLARRGYVFGGSYVPKFLTKRDDYLQFGSAAILFCSIFILSCVGYTLII